MTNVEISFTSEGVTASVYDDLGLIDESWYTWSEVEEMKDNEGPDITFDL